jgi:iron transport multicopper oxidase
MLFQVILLVSWCNLLVNAQQTHYYYFKVSWFNASLDGFIRPVLGINGAFPGPTITSQVGDRVIVNVSNEADQPITIHWHGMSPR